MWFQNRRAKFRKQERLAQQKAGEAPVKAEGKRDKPTSPATSPHPPPAPAPQPAHHALPHLSPPDLKPITSSGNDLLQLIEECSISCVYVSLTRGERYKLEQVCGLGFSRDLATHALVFKIPIPSSLTVRDDVRNMRTTPHTHN